MSPINLSVAMITRNEERDLPRTLDAVRKIADEIVIVDSGSTDRTVEIAESFGAKVYTEEWKGFGLQKNSAMDKCTGRWILFIDADEEVSDELREEIRAIVTNDTHSGAKVYRLRFTSYCFGRAIRHGGWSGFYRVRLFERDSGRYDGRIVHENFETDCEIGSLKGELRHYTYHDLDDYLEKFNDYTTKSAQHYFETNKRRSMFSAYAGACFNFFKSYFLRLGFLDGAEGFMLAKLTSMGVLVKYVKLRQMYQDQSKK